MLLYRGKNKSGFILVGEKFCHHTAQIDRGKILVGENFSHSLKILVTYSRLFFPPDKIISSLACHLAALFGLEIVKIV